MKLRRGAALAALAAAALIASAPAVDAKNGRSKHFPVQLPGAAPGTTFTAVVTGNGTLKRGFGAIGASQPEGVGTYEVTFDANVSQCAYVVTIGEPDNSGAQAAAAATVVGRSGDAASVFIEIFDHKGIDRNRPFHLDVGC